MTETTVAQPGTAPPPTGAASSAVAPRAGLYHLPLALFAAPMGIGGLGIAWREAAATLHAPHLVGEALLLGAAVVWMLVAALHAIRLARHPQALAQDLRHPVRSAFAGGVTIGLLILSGGLAPYAPAAAGVLWSAAAMLHVLIAAWTLRGMLLLPREPAALAPPVLIPLVGNVLAPVIGARLGFETASWMMFGIGALLWLILQPPLFARLVTGPALPPKLRPTLVILLAPPAVGALALAALTGGFGPAPLAVLGLAAVMALVLASLLPDFARTPFAMSWWAWTFPTAAFAAALLAAARAHPAASLGPVLWPALWLVLLAASAILGLVAAATLRAARAGHLLQPEG